MAGTRPSTSLSLWRVLYFVAGTLLLVFLLGQIDLSELARLLARTDARLLLLGGMIYSCKALVRGYRIARLNGEGWRALPRMVRLSLASSLASQVLPLKLGELSYVFLLRKEAGAPVAQGLSSLVILRLFDLLALSLLFILGSSMASIPDEMSSYFYAIVLFAVVLAAVLIGLLMASRFQEAIMNRLSRDPLTSRAAGARLVHALDELLRSLGRYRWQEYGGSTGLACIEWFINYLTFYVVLQAIDFPIRLWSVIISVTFSALASVLPINSFGNFGTQEAGWATALILLGYPKEAAIASGFATHILTLGYIAVLGSGSWFSYVLKARGIHAKETKS